VQRWTAEPSVGPRCRLGEGPLWDAAAQRVRWVDIVAGTVLSARLDGSCLLDVSCHRVDATVGAVALADDGGLLVAGTKALVHLRPDGSRAVGPALLPDGPSRLNDAQVDPSGAVVVGSLSRDGCTGREVLLRVGPDGAVTVLDDDLTLSNGLGWSPDGRTFYSIDSGPGLLWRRPWDPATGAAGPRSLLVRFDDATPDGMCVDAEGRLWVAMWGAGQVRCLGPDGHLLGVVEVAAAHTTSCAFVGPALDVLLVTTATDELGEQQRRDTPASGRLFTARVGATGRLPTPWCSTTGRGRG
jgi:sugar lactone lactonase YvrE